MATGKGCGVVAKAAARKQAAARKALTAMKSESPNVWFGKCKLISAEDLIGYKKMINDLGKLFDHQRVRSVVRFG